MRVNERHHHGPRRSSSAWAKYAAAFRKISLARRSSLFSRSNAFTRACSSVVIPLRRPASTSRRLIQLLNVWAAQPIFPAIAVIAAHWDLCSVSCSYTNRTARSRTSEGNRGRFAMTPTSHTLESPVNSGQVQNVRVRIARKTPIAVNRADQSLRSSTRFIVEVKYIPQHLRNAAFYCRGRFSHPGGML